MEVTLTIPTSEDQLVCKKKVGKGWDDWEGSTGDKVWQKNVFHRHLPGSRLGLLGRAGRIPGVFSRVQACTLPMRLLHAIPT